jgi:Beta-lactamase superfamily domain
MILTPLWHTEFLVDIKNSSGENIRILVDTWLSDYAIWDLMERSVRVRLDTEKIKTLDAIYISHAHTDHFDPYTLVEIYAHAQPLLILPVSLTYLLPLIREYLGDISVHILFPKKTFSLKWVEITGYMFEQENITNEDDVMMLSIANETELLFAEIDTVPDEYDESTARELWRIFTKKEYTTACYLASRNELDGQLRSYDYDAQKRKSWRSEYIANRKEEMRASYEKYEYEEYADLDNIFTLPGFVRGFVGQGIRYPASISASLASLSVFPLSEVVSLEMDMAESCGYSFPQKALIPWRQYKIENGSIESGRKECAIWELMTQNEILWESWEDDRAYASWPLFPRESIDISDAKTRILTILNSRFLSYWSASPVASLRSALIKNNDGAYRIEFKNFLSKTSVVFEYSFSRSVFEEVSYHEWIRVDEVYWFDDILDFLDGKQELYSNFWHKMDTKKVYRLWTCLGANFCNNDLALKKYRLHFERAISWETVNEWVEKVLNSL